MSAHSKLRTASWMLSVSTCLSTPLAVVAQVVPPLGNLQNSLLWNPQARSASSSPAIDPPRTTTNSSRQDVNAIQEIGDTASVPDDIAASAKSGHFIASKHSRGEDQFREQDEFREMVEESSGRTLPVFGEGLFKEGADAFIALNRAPALDDYVIGIGDEVIVRAWGAVDVDYTAIVDSRGEIFLPHVGSIPVAGIRYADLEPRVRLVINKNFKNYGLSVILGAMRTVPVMVVGNVRKPGIYAVNAVSTVLNALAAAGGPASNGSMRHIEVRRSGQLISTLDLYSLLLNGSRSTDIRLVPGDVIHVCPIGRRIAVAGNVATPGIYEIQQGDTISVAIAMSGGFSITANEGQISVERVVNHAYRNAFDVSVETAATTSLEDGDLLLVSHFSEEIRDSVTLRGAVAGPVRRQWRPGLRVRDVIGNNDALIVSDYWRQKNGSLRQPSPKENAEQYRVSVKRSFDEINWDYAVVERLDRDTLRTRLLPFNLAQAMQGDNAQNLELQPGDSITVFSKRDIVVPSDSQTRYVRVEGEVRSPGIYVASSSDALADIIERAGGLTPKAFLFGVEFTRESVRIEQEEHLKRVLDRWDDDVDEMTADQTSQSISADEASQISHRAERAHAMVARLRTLPASGRIALDVNEKAGSVTDLPFVTLEDGDRIYIPTRSQTVTVVGEVFNESAFVYQPGKDAEYYVRLAGGLKSGEQWKNVYVLEANGDVSPANHRLEFRPGSSIVVMPRLRTGNFLRNMRDWTTVLYQFGLGAAAINVLK